MNRREAADEPSMEDILASIRKIIADEPAAATAAPLPLPPVSPVGIPPPTKVVPNAIPAPQPSLTARLNDVFGPGTIVPGRNDPFLPRQPIHHVQSTQSMMDDDLGDLLADGPSSARKPEATKTGAENSSRRPAPLDLSSSDAASSRPLPPPAANARLTELRPVVSAFDDIKSASTLPRAPQPDVYKAEPPVAPRSAPVVIAAMPPSAARTAPPPASPTTSQQSDATTATTATASPARSEPIVLASSKPYIPSPALGPVAVSPQQPVSPSGQDSVVGISPSTLDFLKSASQKADPATGLLFPVMSAPPAPADPSPAFIPSAAPTVIAEPPSPVDLAQPAYEVIAAPPLKSPTAPAAGSPVAPVVDAAQPTPAGVSQHAYDVKALPPVPSPSADRKPPATEWTPVASVAPPPQAAVPEPLLPALDHVAIAATPASIDPPCDSADDAVASALGALAAGLAASAQTPEINVSIVAVPSLPTTPLDTAIPAPISEPSASVEAQPPSALASNSPIVASSALTPVSTSTLDDTAAELLRPMLRQWLDDNMPRIVERALRIELAETVDITPKPDGKP